VRYIVLRQRSYEGRRSRNRMILGFTTIYGLSAYPRGVLDTTLCNKMCQWLVAGGRFSLGTLVSSTNKTDRHDIAEILLKLFAKHANQNAIQGFPITW